MVTVIVLGLLIGVVTGLRSATGVAVFSVAALAGWLILSGTWLSWLGHPLTAVILIVLALVELVMDKRSATPDRTAALGLGGRVVLGGFCGAVLATAAHLGAGGLITAVAAGVIGAVAGCFGGFRGRRRLAAALGGDRSAALVEDGAAVAGAILIVSITCGVLA